VDNSSSTGWTSKTSPWFAVSARLPHLLKYRAIASVGNIMIDAYEMLAPRIGAARSFARFGLSSQRIWSGDLTCFAVIHGLGGECGAGHH
jgi:hypothetical protein